jgi:hypothetical protein
VERKGTVKETGASRVRYGSVCWLERVLGPDGAHDMSIYKAPMETAMTRGSQVGGTVTRQK